MFNKDMEGHTNPIVQQICEAAFEHITIAEKQLQTCELLLAQHLTLDALPPIKKRARVEQMIKTAKYLGEMRFSSNDVRLFYDCLVNNVVSHRLRKRKRPATPAANEEEQHQE